MVDGLSARQVIEMIANDYYEESHDKIKIQRDDYMRWCKEWLALNPVIEPSWQELKNNYE